METMTKNALQFLVVKSVQFLAVKLGPHLSQKFQELIGDKSLEHFRLEYEKLHRALKKCAWQSSRKKALSLKSFGLSKRVCLT